MDIAIIHTSWDKMAQGHDYVFESPYFSVAGAPVRAVALELD